MSGVLAASLGVLSGLYGAMFGQTAKTRVEDPQLHRSGINVKVRETGC